MDEIKRPKGKKRAPNDLDAFQRKVQRYTKIVGRRVNNKGNPATLYGKGNPENGKHMHRADLPRCKAITAAGNPCKLPAMKGATRCNVHGGKWENPKHKANRTERAKREIMYRADARQAKRELALIPFKERTAAQATYREHTRSQKRAQPALLLELIHIIRNGNEPARFHEFMDRARKHEAKRERRSEFYRGIREAKAKALRETQRET